MPEDKEITIYDIARHLNISATTVSRGLKDHPAINKNTRRKIAEAARFLGYRSNTFASSLRSKKTHTLGVIVPRLNSYFMSSVLAGMEKAASQENYNLIITQNPMPALAPGFAIMLLVLAFNLLGNGLRDALNVK